MFIFSWYHFKIHEHGLGIKISLSNSLSKMLLHWSPSLLSKYFPSFHREHTNMFPARPTFPSVHQTLPGNLQHPTPKWSPCVLPSSHPTKLLWPVIPANSETHSCITSIMCLQFHLLGNSTSEPTSSPSQVPCLQHVSLELSQRSTLALYLHCQFYTQLQRTHTIAYQKRKFWYFSLAQNFAIGKGPKYLAWHVPIFSNFIS